MSKDNNFGFVDGLLAAVGIAAAGLMAATVVEVEDAEERKKRRKKREAEESKRAKSIVREAKRKRGKLNVADIVDLIDGKVPSEAALNELLSIDSEQERYDMYGAMKADNVEFSHVQRMKLKHSFTKSYYRHWV